MLVLLGLIPILIVGFFFGYGVNAFVHDVFFDDY